MSPAPEKKVPTPSSPEPMTVGPGTIRKNLWMGLSEEASLDNPGCHHWVLTGGGRGSSQTAGGWKGRWEGKECHAAGLEDRGRAASHRVRRPLDTGKVQQ